MCGSVEYVSEKDVRLLSEKWKMIYEENKDVFVVQPYRIFITKEWHKVRLEI